MSSPPSPLPARILGGGLCLASLLSFASLLLAGGEGGEAAGSAFAALGAFLIGAFSWASLFVPAWFACAAALALLPGWRPLAVSLLASSIFPFMPVAAFARLSADPTAAFAANPFLEALGLPALGGAAAAAALLLAALAVRLSLALARRETVSTERGARPGLLGPPPAASEEAAPVDPTVGGRIMLAPPPASSAPKRLRAIAGAARESGEGEFEFSVPVLPPLPPLRALGEAAEPGDGPGEPSGASAGAGADARAGAAPIPPATQPAASPTVPAGLVGDASPDRRAGPLAGSGQPEGGAAPAPGAAAGPAGPLAALSGAAAGAVHAAGAAQSAEAAAPAGAAAAREGPPPAAPEAIVLKPAAGRRGPAEGRSAAGAAAGAAAAEDGAEAPVARTIEFTSVPPPKPSSAAAEEEAAKAAAVERILALRAARRKDKPYAVPVEGILTAYPDGEYWVVDEKTRRSAEVLRETLAEFNIEAEVTGIRKGPVITMFEILPAPGVKLSKITNLGDNIALRLAASSVRIVAPIPGKHAVGIEVPNERRSIVSLREIVDNEAFKAAKMEVPVILGKDIAGEAQFLDLVQTPHLLIAGATGSGKSVCVNSLILSILFRRSPQEVRLLLIDPKIVELKLYNDIPHLLTPVITEPKRAFQALQYCICEMERRYSMLDRVGVRDVKSYNRKVKERGLAAERLPYIVVIIDEFADLMATTGKELESTLARLAAMSRAVGIHLVLATQRPSIDVITGLIKANIPSRIAFMVASKFDSRIIIDMVGAEKLLGRGDMLVATAWDPFPIRMQGAFVSEEEVEKAVEYVKTLGEPEYIDDEIFIDEEEDEEPSLFGDEDDDPLFEKALEIVLQQGKASASFIQRRLKIGYNRASRLVELMEEKGIVGPAKGSKPRDLVHNPDGLVSYRGAGAEGERRPPARGQGALMPGLETVPGQRVTGRDDDIVAGDDDAGDGVADLEEGGE